MKRFYATIAAATLLLGGCTGSPEGESDYGTIALCPTTDVCVVTRAEVVAGEAPAGNQFAVTVKGDKVEKSWKNVSTFNNAKEPFYMGLYTVSISYGDPTVEGVDKPYYVGSTSLYVQPRVNHEISIEARIANAQTVVRTTENFRRYFHDAEFTVTTGRGNVFTFAQRDAQEPTPVYVEAGTTLTIQGKAMLQSQTGLGFDRPYTFPDQAPVTTAARTRHTITFDAKSAGSVTVTLTLSEDFVETREFEIELNEGAI